ncbi:hypothetical protein HON22_05270 [Candidatus Peregrinibacteria bacterium]|jgi:hypothetical protein|nr:hypothetical protein [Candidatus Peregrinibacteria bacterium]
MQEYLESLEEIFSILKDSNGENADEIKVKIESLSLHAEKSKIEEDFSLALIFKQAIREDIQRVLSMNKNSIVSTVNNKTFNINIHRAHVELKEVINDTKRFKAIILEHGMHLKSLKNIHDIGILKEKIRKRDSIIKNLFRKINA